MTKAKMCAASREWEGYQNAALFEEALLGRRKVQGGTKVTRQSRKIKYKNLVGGTEF